MARRKDIWGQVALLPLFLMLLGLSALSMLVPAVHGTIVRDLDAARAFLYAGLLGLILFLILAVVHLGRTQRSSALGPLLSLFSAFTLLPVFFAVPFVETLTTTRFLNAYVEMVSAVTTTGATLFQDPERLSPTLHLWRAQVGWMGGLLMWVAASAILAPLHLGGFEVTTRAEPGRQDSGAPGGRTVRPILAHQRVAKSFAALAPIYGGLTLLLWILLLGGGEAPLTALCHAMSIMATSGISPIGGVENSTVTVTGEMVMMLFMLFALSRLTFSKDTITASDGGVMTDPEFRIGAFLVVAVPLVIFLRHFIGAADVDASGDLLKAAQALWGAFFTVLSFLTTTGFVSEYWADAKDWSGLGTSGLILMGLAVIGGGGGANPGGGGHFWGVWALPHSARGGGQNRKGARGGERVSIGGGPVL